MFSGGVIAFAPLIAACSSGPSYDDWAATDGAAGRINLDDVQQAFQSSESATEFETRVNEIYEGEGIILIRASQDGDKLTLEGWEDLNNTNSIDEAQDEMLFAIVKENNEYDLRGQHANGYYNSHFGAGNFLFTYMLLSSFGGGRYFYNTGPSRGTTIRNQRGSYRNSSRYGSQVSRNSRFANNQKNFAGSRYQQASRNTSAGRQTYQQTQKTSGTFKNTSSFRTSSSRSSASRGSGGGYRGGGGSQVILGRKRH